MSDADLDLVAAYAVDALDPDERARVERRLDEDPALRAALDAHLETLAALTDDADAPPELLERILADLPEQGDRPGDEDPPVTRTALTLTRRSEPEDWHHESPPPAMTPSSHVDATQPLDDARRARVGRIVRTVLAAAAVVALLLVGIGLVARDTDTADLGELANNALVDPDARVVDLADPEGGDVVARAAIYDDGGGYLVVDGLPALDADETYQLWMLPSEGTDPISLGLVDPLADDGSVAFRLGPDAAGVALSREPADGSVTPTEVVAAGTFT